MSGDDKLAEPIVRSSPHRWRKGESGNPAGRRPEPERAKVRDLARKHTRSAVAALLRVMRSRKSPESAVVGAAVALLNRGWGMPQQNMDVKTAAGGIVIMLPPEDEDPTAIDAQADAVVAGLAAKPQAPELAPAPASTTDAKP